MCVLIYKPKGADLPNIEILNACHERNPHGSGFVTSKGVMFKTLNFKHFLYTLSNQVKKEDEAIIHFRLATHGSICKANCHPFKNGDIYFAHNGVLNVIPYYNKTDSETAFIKYFLPIIRKHGVHSRQLASIVNSVIGYSKFAFMQDGKVRLFGRFMNINGIYYSNTLWQTNKKIYA